MSQTARVMEAKDFCREYKTATKSYIFSLSQKDRKSGKHTFSRDAAENACRNDKRNMHVTCGGVHPSMKPGVAFWCNS